MVKSRWNVGLCLGLLGLLSAPSSALACTALARTFVSSLPVSGSQGVPLDVAPVVRGHWEPDSLVWEAEDGARVPFDLISGPQQQFVGRIAELVPREPLRPNARYFIRARLFGMQESIVFTTGDAMAEAVTDFPPQVAVSVLDGIRSSCVSGDSMICASVGQTASLLEVLATDGTLLLRDVIEGDVFTYVTAPGCVRLSARSASGKLSAPRVLCDDQLPTRPVRDETLGFHECRDGEFRLRDGGGPDDTSDAATSAINASADAAAASSDVSARDARSESDTSMDARASADCGIARAQSSRSSFSALAALALALNRRRTQRKR